jgi:hypothetical protein
MEQNDQGINPEIELVEEQGDIHPLESNVLSIVGGGLDWGSGVISMPK